MGFDFYKGIIPDPEEERIRQRTYAKTIEKDYGKRPIYFYNSQYLRYKTDFVTIPVGLIYKAHKKSEPLPKIKDWWNIYNIYGINDERFYNDERINPFICDFHLRKARYHINAKQPEKVAQEYSIVEKTKNLNGMTEVALYWLNNKNAAYALSLLRETLEIDETITVNYYNLGLTLIALREEELAVDAFQTFLKSWQGESRYYEDAYRRMRTLANKSLNAQDLNNIGIRYMWKGEYQRAIKLFDEGIKVRPTNPLILLNLAISYEQLNDIAKSGYYYQNFLNVWQGEEKYRDIARKGLERLRHKAGIPTA
jgi:tetratricopeptide (TPR) repeat protein